MATGDEHYVKVTLEKEYDVQAVQLVWEGASAKEYTVTLTAATVWGIKLKEMKVMGAEKGTTVGVEEVEVTAETIVDVFNLQGVCVLRGAKVMDIINLPAGIYVAGGRKYIVR